ncbi:N-acetylmuramoyl-L-alanine amidase family protein [Paenibacillus massiliensis]|uniref:N-acetylmuramoyl-L-alanine amidase family protein n=1 Tax=Paenibacillus massiliensis TaxID=225917 RepID=UPI00037DACBB|nr:N-acetylmuramoyl-L-alanine amidase [Paenibacillus massiliensis]
MPTFLMKSVIGALMFTLLPSLTGSSFTGSTALRVDASSTPLPQEITQEDVPHHPIFTSPVIIIDAGHGGIDGGTSHHGVLEKEINLTIARKLYLLLHSSGYAAVLNRDGDYALSEHNHWMKSSRHRKDLAQRKSLTEELPTVLVVSLHANWSKRSDRQGPIVLYQQEGHSYLLADCIQQALNQLHGTSRLSVSGKAFFLLNHIKQPAVIVETGFISNEQDRRLLQSTAGQKAIADSIADGITHYLSAW